MTESALMLRCLELAERARGRTAPNPVVGAVIARDGAILAEGWHHAVGLAHAEANAIEAARGLDLSGAAMFVNLEPCCHFGRTPPCTDAILASGLRRMVVGMVDPDPRVSGRGIAMLREAGLTVDVGVEEALCRVANAPYLLATEKRRPWVTLKAGITLDGRIASDRNESRWITGPEAREATHRLRDRHDAVLVGSGTLLADDPALDTRIEGGRNAVPVVLDSALLCPESARVLTAGRRPILYCAPDAPERALAADVVRVPSGDGALDLSRVMSDLVSRGVHGLLVEGGARVHRSFLDAGLVDRIELFVAPKVLAGGSGWVGGSPFRLADAPRFHIVQVERLGLDLRLVLQCSPAS